MGVQTSEYGPNAGDWNGRESGPFQEITDLPPNRSYDYSTASAIVFSLLRIARGLLELAVLGRLLLTADREVTRKILALVALRWLVGPMIGLLEREIDGRFVRELHTAQALRTTEMDDVPRINRFTQSGDDIAFIFEGAMDRALGWDAGRQAEGAGAAFRHRVLFLRPYRPGNRFILNLMPFTSADPEPLPKWPLLELSLFRLIHGLGGTFVSPGYPDEPTGSPRTLMGGDWQRRILKEMRRCDLIFMVPFYTPGTAWEVEQIFGERHLAKTLFVMPPSYLSTPIDMRAKGLWDCLIMLAIRVAVSGSDSSVIYTGRRLRITPEDPTVKGDWEAARERFSQRGIVLPAYSPLGAVFSCSGISAEPQLHAPLATVVSGNYEEPARQVQLITRLKEFTARTGGNARSILAAIEYSTGGFDHTSELLSAILDRLEQRPPFVGQVGDSPHPPA
jgi:hypothetical protein